MRAIFLLASLVLGCRTTTSAVRHDAEIPVLEGQAPFWVQQSDQEYFGITQQLATLPFDFKQKPEAALSPDHPLSKRLQGWIDRLDERLRGKYPGMLDAVPRPRVRILNVNDINAYVAPMTICYDNVGVRWAEGDSTPLTPHRGAVYQDGTFSDASGPSDQLLCRHAKASSNDIVTWLSRINTTDRTCKLKLKRLADDAFEIAPGSGCNIEPKLRILNGVSTFVVTPTVQNVTVYAGILRLLSEEQMIAVLYHELGHYYHGHTNAPTGRYNYLYHLEATNPGTAPQFASDLAQVNADLEQAQDDIIKATNALAFAKQSIPAAIYQDISGQRYHTALFVALKRLVESNREANCAPGSACSHCDQASQTADAKLNRFALAEVGITGPLSDDEQKGYLDFEHEAAACLEAKAIVANDLTAFDPGVRSHVLTPPSILALLKDASFGLTLPLIADIEPQGNLGNYLNQISSRLKDKYPKFKSTDLSLLPSSLSWYQNQVGQLGLAYQRLEGFDQRAQRDHLGYYTIEEEADDLAIEWLSLAGFDPVANPESDLKLLTLGADAQAVAQCTTQRQAKWLGPDGQPVLLPWGPFADPHPGTCFRVRNGDQEIAAHGYPSSGPSPAAGLSPSWSELVAMIGGPLPPFTYLKAKEQTPDDKKTVFIRCRFAPKK